MGDRRLAWSICVHLGAFFCFFCIICFMLFVVLVKIIWHDTIFTEVVNKIIAIRYRLTWGKWVLAAAVCIFPFWFLKFSLLGIVFHGLFFRLSIWAMQLFFVSILITQNDKGFVNWKIFLGLLIFTASSFSIMASLNYVTSYPFSLGWSEGNRIWDYSILWQR